MWIAGGRGGSGSITGSLVFFPSKSHMIALGSEEGACAQFHLQRLHPESSLQGLGSDSQGLPSAVPCVLAGFGPGRFSRTSLALPAPAHSQGWVQNRVTMMQVTCISGLTRISNTWYDQNDAESGRNPHLSTLLSAPGEGKPGVIPSRFKRIPQHSEDPVTRDFCSS